MHLIAIVFQVEKRRWPIGSDAAAHAERPEPFRLIRPDRSGMLAVKMIAALSGPAELKQFDRYALLKKWTSVDQQFQAHVAGIYTNP